MPHRNPQSSSWVHDFLFGVIAAFLVLAVASFLVGCPKPPPRIVEVPVKVIEKCHVPPPPEIPTIVFFSGHECPDDHICLDKPNAMKLIMWARIVQLWMAEVISLCGDTPVALPPSTPPSSGDKKDDSSVRASIGPS